MDLRAFPIQEEPPPEQEPEHLPSQETPETSPDETEPEPESLGGRPRGSMAQPYGASASPPEDELERLLREE